MHIHVDVADDDEGVRVIDGIRPWLPLLVALSANSPYWQGRDTGHASWRSQVWGRWPSAGAAQPFGDVATYRAVTEQMIGWGGSLDPAMLYFDIRLAERYPTVEIRVADVTTEVEDVVLVSVLARALVATVAADERPPTWRADLLRVAGWRAAHLGMAGDAGAPGEPRHWCRPREAVAALVAHVRPALEDAGDLDLVTDSFERLVARGTGATRQRPCSRPPATCAGGRRPRPAYRGVLGLSREGLPARRGWTGDEHPTLPGTASGYPSGCWSPRPPPSSRTPPRSSAAARRPAWRTSGCSPATG